MSENQNKRKRIIVQQVVYSTNIIQCQCCKSLIVLQYSDKNTRKRLKRVVKKEL